MQKSVEKALDKWIEEHNAFDMSKDEAACRFMLEVINKTAFVPPMRVLISDDYRLLMNMLVLL